MVGQRIDGKYELIKVLGQGAMGVVYRARHAATGREVALKLVQPDRIGVPGTAAASAALERFQREARAMGAVADSPHVVQVLDAGADRDSGAAFMVMELLNGEDVETLAGRLGPLPVDLALRIVAQALTGLVPAHEAGIVHRDIKPSNLFLAKRADGERIVKVLDFGIVKLLDPASGPGGQTTDAPSKLTRTGGTLGSPAYMSPEQVQASKQLDTRTDLWSMGVVLYQLLCGALPFQEVTELPQLLLAIYFRDPPRVVQRVTWVPPEVDAIVHRALQRDLTARYATAREMREAIARVLGGATAITEGMLVASSPEARSMQAAASAMAMAVSVPGPQGGGTTRISGWSPSADAASSATGVSSAMGMSPASAMPATAGAAGTARDTTPLSALPVSGLPIAAASSIAAPAAATMGTMRSPPSAAVPAETARSSDPRMPSGAAPGAAATLGEQRGDGAAEDRGDTRRLVGRADRGRRPGGGGVRDDDAERGSGVRRERHGAPPGRGAAPRRDRCRGGRCSEPIRDDRGETRDRCRGRWGDGHAGCAARPLPGGSFEAHAGGDCGRGRGAGSEPSRACAISRQEDPSPRPIGPGHHAPGVEACQTHH